MTRREFAYLAAAPAASRMSRAWSADRLAATLLPREKWRPFPSASERGPWEALPSDARATVLEAGERDSKGDWPSLPAAVFLEYQRNGNRTHFEALQFGRRNRLRDLVVAECVDGRGCFSRPVLNGLWLILRGELLGRARPPRRAESRQGPARPPSRSSILFAAETGSLLAWTDYLLGPQLDKVSPLLRPRVQREVQRRLLTPCFERDDFWWMGFNARPPVNNWNPWINSNLARLRAARRARTGDGARRPSTRSYVASTVFLDGYAPDGGCDEGPSYWGRAGASLFDCLRTARFGVRRLDRFLPRCRWSPRSAATSSRAHIHDRGLVRQLRRRVRQAGHQRRSGVSLRRRIGDEPCSAIGAWAAPPASRFPRTVSSRQHSGGRCTTLFDCAGTLRTIPRRSCRADLDCPEFR